MANLDYLPVDADNHYYEPHDCCSRHLERKYLDTGRVCHVARNAEGVDEWRWGDRPLGFHQTTRDFVLPPGAYRPFMSERARTEDPGPPPKPQSSDIPQFRDKDARIKTLDKQGLQASIMLPSFGIAFETDTLADPEGMLANMRSFNRFVEDDWGYHYKERIFAFPHLSLVDLDWAVEELERVVALGAKGIILRAGPVCGRSRSCAKRVLGRASRTKASAMAREPPVRTKVRVLGAVASAGSPLGPRLRWSLSGRGRPSRMARVGSMSIDHHAFRMNPPHCA